MPPPLGFNFNHGANFVPCIITNSKGRGIPARYTRVIMGPDPHVIGIIPGDCSQYGGPLYAIPDHNQGEHPWYTHDDLWHFKYGTDERVQFDNTLEHIHNLLLTAEVMRFCEASCLFFVYQEEVCKLKNACGRPDNSRMRVLVGWRVLTRWTELRQPRRSLIAEQYSSKYIWNMGVPPEKGVMSRNGHLDSYYMVMTNVSK